MTASKSHAQLDKLLKQIRVADNAQVEAQLEIASILTAIQDHGFFAAHDYPSFRAMVAAELDFPYSAACRYVSLYNSYTRLRYSKTEFLKLMQKFGWRRVEETIKSADKKLGMRAIAARLAQIDSRDQQFNFNLYDKATAVRFEAILARFGLEHTPAGTRTHLSTSLLALIDDYEARVARDSSLPATKAKQLSKPKKPRVSKVRVREPKQMELTASE